MSSSSSSSGSSGSSSNSSSSSSLSPHKIAVVTGAGGFLGSHVVDQLLRAGYHVRGTVRSAEASKNAHLTSLHHASERLSLHVIDLLDPPEAFAAVFSGAEVVMHTASPFLVITKAFEKGEDYFVKPAVDGTLNVLKGATLAGVQSVVLTSSTAAVFGAREPGHSYSEEDWNDPPSLREKRLWYILSKTLAERAAYDYIKEQGAAIPFRFSTINPAMIGGPMLQSALNASSEVILSYLDGSKAHYAGGGMGWIDVRDVAKAHLLAHERRSAGRHLLVSEYLSYADFVERLRGVEPAADARIPRTLDPAAAPAGNLIINTAKALSVGMAPFIPLEAMLRDSIDSYKALGLYKL